MQITMRHDSSLTDLRLRKFERFYKDASYDLPERQAINLIQMRRAVPAHRTDAWLALREVQDEPKKIICDLGAMFKNDAAELLRHRNIMRGGCAQFA